MSLELARLRDWLGGSRVPPVATLNEDPPLPDDDEVSLGLVGTHRESEIKLLERLSCRIGDSGGETTWE